MDDMINKVDISEWVKKKTTQCLKEITQYFNALVSDNANLKKVNYNPRVSEILSLHNDKATLEQRTFEKAEDVQVCFDSYKRVVSKINQYVVYIASIQNFCMFMGWRDEDYKQMMINSPVDVQMMMSVVDQYMIEQTASAAQQGLISPTIARFRLQMAGSHGHNLVTQKEQNSVDRDVRRLMSKDELKRKLLEMGGGNTDSE